MGASLPAIVRWTESTPRGASWWGLLYGGNTVGAVFGCLLAGFYLLRMYNMTTATLAAALINVAVALAAWWLAKRSPATTSEADTTFAAVV
jgi:spermidine synthase